MPRLRRRWRGARGGASEGPLATTAAARAWSALPASLAVSSAWRSPMNSWGCLLYTSDAADE
eukprot:15182278-Heterocapsa_arctica.AAC.1